MTGSESPSLAQKIRWLLEDLRAYQPEKIILFGSAARGDADEHSDLDVVLVKETRDSFVQRGIDAARHIRLGVGAVDILVYTPEEFRRMQENENPFVERVLADGRVLYEKAA